MNGISCFVNFKENLNKNLPYYDLLIRQINGSGNETNPWCGEHAILSCGNRSQIVSKVCEGYQFTIAFSGYIHDPATPKNQLCRFGYHFFTEDDAEIVLTSYIHFGEDCIKQFSGEFSFIIYDSMRRQILVASDSLGCSAIFFSNIDDSWILSSSISGILTHPKIKRKISGSCILELISAQNRIPENIFENVHILPPGQILKITSEKAERKVANHFYEPITPPLQLYEKSTTDIIASGDSEINDLLKQLGENQQKNHPRINLYARRLPEGMDSLSVNFHKIPVEHSSVLEGIFASVEALGVPFLTPYDHLLTRTAKLSSTDDHELFFMMPDRFDNKKSYLDTLIKNDAFTFGIKPNIENFSSKADIYLPYPGMIGDYFDKTIKTHFITSEVKEHPAFGDFECKRILRRILLDIISKEYPPITAFFRREALLKLCEGGFFFRQHEDESELIAYLIKLNIWLEKFKPQII